MKVFVFSLLMCIAAYAGAQDLAALLEMAPPAQARVFAAGIISDGLNNRDFTLSPDGNEIFYTIQSAKFFKSSIICMRKVKGVWQKPAIAPFSGRYRDLEAFFSPDGKSIYFSSDRPADANDQTSDFDIWRADRSANGWGDPVHLGFEVNSAKNEFYPSVTRAGTLYFTAQPDNGYGEEDIVSCAFSNGKYLKRELLSTAINTPGDEFNAFADPDENFIIFSSYKGRKDEQGGGDLYISKKVNGKWQAAINMGSDINTGALDYCPFVSTDKKKLFFSSNRTALKDTALLNYHDLVNALNNVGNALDDIYIADFSVFLK